MIIKHRSRSILLLLGSLWHASAAAALPSERRLARVLVTEVPQTQALAMAMVSSHLLLHHQPLLGAVLLAGDTPPPAEDVLAILMKMKRALGHDGYLDRVEHFLDELDLLRAVGILNKGTRLFNPLSGANLIPGLFALEMWTADSRLSRSTSEAYFNDLVDTLARTHENARDRLPNVTMLCAVHHYSDNVLYDSLGALNQMFIANWTQEMKAGDVVYLRFVREYLLAGGAPVRDVDSWIAPFLDAIPEGVRLVIFEYPPFGIAARCQQSEAFADLAEYLFGTHKPLFDEIYANEYLTYSNLVYYRDRINVTHQDEWGTPLNVDFGGRMSIFQKVGTPQSLPKEQPAGSSEEATPIRANSQMLRAA
jgi:hypothetical protein